ncbi:MAG: ornithine aminomutase subunit alpha [bacterium]|nr:ornithine aminomutase subunit alpha [bacterium]
MKRNDDFLERRKHLANLSDQELEQRFWSLVGQLVDPLLEMGRENTTPAIERSVLLRMGFSSLEARDIVNGCLERELLGHGAGNVVYRLAKKLNLGIREAGLTLIEGQNWELAIELFSTSSPADQVTPAVSKN